VAGRVDEVDQESIAVVGLLDVLHVRLVHLKVHGDGSGLDGDTTVLLSDRKKRKKCVQFLFSNLIIFKENTCSS